MKLLFRTRSIQWPWQRSDPAAIPQAQAGALPAAGEEPPSSAAAGWRPAAREEDDEFEGEGWTFWGR